MARFKQKCFRCKKNFVLVTSKQKYVLCYDCQKDELSKEIKDKNMKKLFDIPEDYYKDNIFLRNIKISFLRYGNLTEKQINAFKKTVKELSENGNTKRN
mgnify:FL=1